MTETVFKQEVKKEQNIIIYGAGMVGELVYKRLSQFEMQNKIITFAVSKKVGESSMFGLPICEIKDCVSHVNDALVIVATLPILHKDMQVVLEKYGFQNIVFVDEELYESMATSYIEDFKNTHTISMKNIDVLLMASDNNCASGAFLCLVDLARELKELGICALVILPMYGTGEKLLQENNLDYWFVESEDWTVELDEDIVKKKRKLEKNESAIKEIEMIIKNYHVRVLHNNTTYTYVGAVAAHNCELPVIWHLREFLQAQGREFYDERAKAFINKSDRVLLTSQYVGTCIDYVDKDLVSFIYDGVDTTNYFLEDKRLFVEDVLNIIIVGNVIPLKNQMELLEAAALLKERTETNFHISIIGSGEKKYINVLEDFIEENHLEKNVSFLGRQSDVQKYYRRADVVVVCSKAEAFGRTTIESQLSGCVTIGAKAGATSELIHDMETGLLYELGNSSELADKILWCINNHEAAVKIAKQGQAFASSQYTKRRNAEEIIKIYRQYWKI